MKLRRLLIIVCILLTAACDFEVPLTTNHTIPIDESLLGVWQEIDGEETSEQQYFVTILRFSDTEYLAEYYSDDSSIYFRGYLVEVADRLVFQTEVIGDQDGPPGQNASHLFSVGLITVENDMMIISGLNTKLIPGSISSSAVLRDAFIKEKDNPQLFVEPGRYKKIRR